MIVRRRFPCSPLIAWRREIDRFFENEKVFTPKLLSSRTMTTELDGYGVHEEPMHVSR
jgi:hypothetical protein